MIKAKKKVIIVGAGPAGLFAALKMSEKGNFDIKIFDKGGDLADRFNDKWGVCGLGGAGLFSDGKLNFTSLIGTNLLEIIAENKVNQLMDEVEKIFTTHCRHQVGETSVKWQKKINLEKRAIKMGVKFLPYRGMHIGSDLLPGVINGIKENLEKNKVQLIFNKEIVKITEREVYFSSGQEKFDYLLLAPGRGGAFWLEKIVQELGINYKYNPLDLGIRVETTADIMEEVCNIEYDPKFYIKTPTYEDVVRTFCTCPQGFVASEKHKGFYLVNGYSNHQVKSKNTNFAFLVKVRLTEPLENTNLFGETIANEANVIGGGKPIIQKFGDLLRGRRSTWSRIEKGNIEPTLGEVTPGDISMAMPYRFVKDIIEGLEALNKIISGLTNDDTLLYAPEIKFHGLRIITDNFLATNLKNIFVAGDGVGLSRGIAGAAVSGLLAAEGIIEKNF